MIKIILLIFFSINLLSAFADEFIINDVNVICKNKIGCKEIRKIFKSLKRNYSGKEHFYSVLKLYVANEGIKELSFHVTNDGKFNYLQISVKKKLRIIDISQPYFKGNSEIELPSVIPLKLDDYLDEQRVKDTEKLFKDIAKDKGYPNALVNIKVLRSSRGARLKINIDLKKGILIKSITVNSKSFYLKTYLNKKIGYHKNRPFDIQQLKDELESLRKLFHQFGYYLIDFNLQYQYSSKNEIKLFIGVKNAKRYAFYIKDIEKIGMDEFKEYLSDNLISSKRELNEENLSVIVKDYFEKNGYKFSNANIKIQKSLDINKDEMIQYEISLEQGGRTKLSELQFKGNSFFTTKSLEEFYYEFASSQAEENIFDNTYYQDFRELLREKYISNGFVSVFVEKPVVLFDSKQNTVGVIYKIREGIRNFVSTVNIDGTTGLVKSVILKNIQTKVSKAFNPIMFKEDLSYISNYLKNEGYYFARIKNLNSKNLVQYISDNSQVNLNIEIEMGPKIYANQIIIIGNHKTRKILIKRELEFKSGSLITNKGLEQSQANLLSLGIFSSVQIKPVTQNSAKTDILIFVREKDFGSVVLAPGIRTDLGLKLSTAVTYNNIDGMNKRIGLQGTVNRRFDLSSLDDTRRTSSEVLTEYDLSVQFSEDHIFHSNYDFITSVSNQRKRFFAYDVDLKRFGYTFSRDFTKWFKASARQQIEIISQYNATADINHGHFQIGSFTPAISFDFRDRKINPTKGVFSKFSVEIANPYFLSQSNDELTINYVKYVNRNKIYIPINNQLVFAISTSFGLQENKANSDGETGYIPSFKVFRLSGADIVRGYDDSEINRLDNGNDISVEEVSTRAFMANIKLEPRFYLTDSTILGVFYDAGRVAVDELSYGDLRSSVGLSFKLVTPVGTLDIDYGIKTLRKKNSSGKLDSPGRLHVSIGFF